MVFPLHVLLFVTSSQMMGAGPPLCMRPLVFSFPLHRLVAQWLLSLNFVRFLFANVVFSYCHILRQFATICNTHVSVVKQVVSPDCFCVVPVPFTNISLCPLGCSQRFFWSWECGEKGWSSVGKARTQRPAISRRMCSFSMFRRDIFPLVCFHIVFFF